jgi:hypothetical protein
MATKNGKKDNADTRKAQAFLEAGSDIAGSTACAARRVVFQTLVVMFEIDRTL